MAKLELKNKDCLRGGCLRWQYAQKEMPTPYIEACWRCGFNVAEDLRRKQIPLTLCDDGLRRKLIPPRGKETEVEDDAGGNDDSGIAEEGDGDGEEEPGT